MSNLMGRVRGHCTGQRTSGQNTLALVVECVDHIFLPVEKPSGDWSPLAYLIGKSEAAQSRAVRKAVGQVLMGYTIQKDAEQVSGFRFVKRKGANTGIVDAKMNALRDLVKAGASIQSEATKRLWAKPDEAPKPIAEILQTRAANLVKAMHKENVSDAAILAAVQAALKAAKANV